MKTKIPKTFQSIRDFTAQTGLPTGIITALRDRGCAVILPNGRVDFRAVLSGIAKFGIGGTEQIDLAHEEKRLAKARADEQERLNREAEGQLLLSKDRTFAINQLEVTNILFGEMLGPLRNDLLRMAKKHGLTEEMAALFALHLARVNLADEGRSAVSRKAGNE